MYPEIGALKSILTGQDYISQKDSNLAEKASKNSDEYVDYLLREGLLTKALLGQALAEAYRLPYSDLVMHPPLKEDISKIPEDLAKKQRVVVVKDAVDLTTIATDSPNNIDATALKSVLSNKAIKLTYALPEYIAATLSGYQRPLETRFSQIIAGSRRIAPEIVEEIIKDAVAYRASDIHFEPHQNSVVVRFRVDGRLRNAGTIPKEFYENVLNRIKVEAGLRIDEHYAAQDGAIQKKLESRTVDLRVSLIPTVDGEKVVMRVLGSYVQSFNFADVGLSDANREKLYNYANKPFGMILATGPTGSGKTTTLYSLIKMLNTPSVNITSIEDPVEYKIFGVNQIQVREATGITFAKGLRSIVRQDPDIILVGEIRDRETAEISVNAALTGHLLLSTFHANDAATAIPRLVDMGVEPFLIASTLEVVIARRLVRTICNSCKFGMPLANAISSLQNNKAKIETYFSANDTVYAGKGCEVCGNTGYSGRTALFELVEITPEMQDLILKKPSTREVAELSHGQGSKTMFEDGIDKIKGGQTTISEVLRVVEAPKNDERSDQWQGQ
ncbi:MAG: GspE/PulE family protein [Candidatus Woesebacteria bacterium]|jgi:type IV pilus assembly protein PilB